MEILIDALKVLIPLLAFVVGYGKLIAKVDGIETLINAKLGIADNKIQKDLNVMDQRLTKEIAEVSERVVKVETKLEIDSEPGLLEG